MRRVVLPLLVILAGCSTQNNVVQAPVVVSVGPVDGSAPSVAAAPKATATAATGDCHVTLHAQAVSMSSPGCYIDGNVRDTVGLLTYDCDGNGNAFATFGLQRYEGSIQDGELDLHAETELDWNDGCHWGTTAIIRGAISGNLVWTYEDRVITGTSCSGVCHANTTFEVTKGE